MEDQQREGGRSCSGLGANACCANTPPGSRHNRRRLTGMDMCQRARFALLQIDGERVGYSRDAFITNGCEQWRDKAMPTSGRGGVNEKPAGIDASAQPFRSASRRAAPACHRNDVKVQGRRAARQPRGPTRAGPTAVL
jgi:hypothetical protein